MNILTRWSPGVVTWFITKKFVVSIWLGIGVGLMLRQELEARLDRAQEHLRDLHPVPEEETDIIWEPPKDIRQLRDLSFHPKKMRPPREIGISAFPPGICLFYSSCILFTFTVFFFTFLLSFQTWSRARQEEFPARSSPCTRVTWE